MKSKLPLYTVVVFCCFVTTSASVFAQIGTAFTYQGQLSTTNGPANGTYDLTFELWTQQSPGGSQVGTTYTNLGTGITNGLFTVIIDFGSQFNGSPYYLQLGVRTNGGGAFAQLTPRQELTPTPYAITAENVNGTVSASQLTGTLLAGQLSGTYGNAVTLNNAGNVIDGSGSGLTALNASHLTTGTVADARLSTNVAFLNASQTFGGVNTFVSGGSAGRLIVSNGFFNVDTTPFTGLSLQYNSDGEAAIMSSYPGGDAFLTFYTTLVGQPTLEQMMLDSFGGLALDQQGVNNGTLNDGTTNGVGLTFGINSGEGIASKQTAGGDQYGLDFYTAFARRMSITQFGRVGVNTVVPAAQLDVETGANIGIQGVTASTAAGANGVFGQVNSTLPGEYSAGVMGQNNDTNGNGIGVYGTQNGYGDGVYGFTPGGDGVYGQSTTGIGVNGFSSSGYGVIAQSSTGTGLYAFSGTTSPALVIGSGTLHVSGAGVGTTTAAFIHKATAANIFAPNYTVIDNSQCNGDSNAILIVTQNWNPRGATGVYNTHHVGVLYGANSLTNWGIFNEDGTAMVTNSAYNVLVIKN